MAKLIRALLGFFRVSDNDLIARALAMVKGFTGNKELARPPYTLEEVQACIDSFVQSIPDALDGGKKAIAEKNNRRKELEKVMKLQAAYLCGGSLQRRLGDLLIQWAGAPVDASGAPGAWSTQLTGNARSAIAFNNLTPGTLYTIQVRALGKLGHTDWSAANSRMVI